MTNKRKTYFNWSSGKDASLALYHILKDEHFDVAQLFTSINSEYNRISMHGVRKELLIKQAESIGLPLSVIELPAEPDMETYEQKLTQAIEALKQEGFTDTAFGDIFLEDLKDYRINQLKKVDIEAHFPIWKRNTKELIEEFLERGFRAKLVCINAKLLDKSFAGRDIDKDFLNDLPKGVDPCGENGEYHTFCYDGPIFNKPIDFTLGEVEYREYDSPENKDEKHGFWFRDLIPV